MTRHRRPRRGGQQIHPSWNRGPRRRRAARVLTGWLPPVLLAVSAGGCVACVSIWNDLPDAPPLSPPSVATITMEPFDTTVTFATPTPTPTPTLEPDPTPTSEARIWYSSCEDARDAGAAPLRLGEAGYRPALDRDGDGTACDR